MRYKLLESYSMAKNIVHEVFLQTQLAQAGSRSARYLESLEKRKKHFNIVIMVMKIAYSFALFTMPLLMFIAYKEIFEWNSGPNIEAMFLTFGYTFSMFLLLSILYLLLFGILSTGSFMSGESFLWLQTLPITQKNLKRLASMTIFRSLDIPLITMIVTLPLFMLIATQDIIVFLISILVSIPNVILSFGILIILSERISRILFNKEKKSAKAQTVKVITIIAYMVVSMSLSFIITFAMRSIEDLQSLFSSLDNVSIWNIIMSLIPYPFAPTYMISLSSSPGDVPQILWFTTLIGFILFLLISYVILKIAINSITSISSARKKKKKKSKDRELDIQIINIEIEIKTTSPIKAYIKKDIKSIIRDPQSFMMLLMPMIFPFIFIFSGFAAVISESNEIIEIYTIIILNLFICSITPGIIISGLLNIEETGSSTVSSLPIIPRDQAKAKLVIIIVIQLIGFIIPPIIASIFLQNGMIAMITLCTLPLSFIFVLVLFEMKFSLFGKMKYKYIIEELYKERKVRKWILMILTNLGLVLLNLILLFLSFNFLIYALIALIVGITGLIVLGFGFNMMFPAKEKIGTYETGGLLRRIPVLGASGLTLLYWTLPLLISLPVVSIIYYIYDLFSIVPPFLTSLIIEFSLNLFPLIILCLILIPFGLKLPKKEQNMESYLINIKLDKNQPIFKNISIGIIAFLIIIGPILIGSYLLGEYEFNPKVLIQSPSLINGYGWFIFFIMLIPGIWEEVTFRGVMIPMFKKKYTNITSIILSGIFFGILHFGNFLNVFIGWDPLSIVLQIIFAAFLGIGLGYMYTKTNSLIPCIIFHYIYNIFIVILAPNIFNDLFSQIIYTIFFLGIIPMILIITFVKLVTYKKRNT